MKKYKLLKDLPFVDKGEIFRYEDCKLYCEDWNKSSYNVLFEDMDFNELLWEWLEEVNLKPKPKFRVWDKVKTIGLGSVIYTTIAWFHYKEELKEFEYFTLCITNCRENELKIPTEYELNNYYEN